MAEQCESYEESLRTGHSRKLYETVKKLTRDWKNSTRIVKNTQGEKVASDEEVKALWKTHFEGIFSVRDEQHEGDDMIDIEENWNTGETPNIMKSETEQNLKALANNKAPGVDGVPKELLEAGGEEIARWLHKICQGAIEGKGVAEEWGQAEIIPIHKKGDTADCANYRPISLLPHAYKTVHTRIKRREEEIYGEEQAGFRSGRGTTDHIFTLTQIIEKRWEKAQNTYCAFIDFKQAFDSVHREGMMRVMRSWGFQESLVRAIEELYGNTTARVRKADVVTETFPTTRGVIQGCPLSPHLYNLYLERVMLEALEEEEGGVEVSGVKFTNMRYADDIVIVAKTRDDLQRMLEKTEEQCKRFKLEINKNKTKSMKIAREREVLNVRLGTGEIEQVQDFKYLGVNIGEKGKTEKSVRERIGMGQRAFGRLKKIWRSNTVSMHLKLRLLSAIVIPTTLYGAECWILSKAEEKKLLDFQMKCPRRICGISWEDRVRNEEVRRRTGQSVTILDRQKDMQRRWFGHVVRMSGERWPNIVMHGRVDGTRPRGRPGDTWRKKFKMANEGRSWGEVMEMATNKKR